MTLKTNYIVKYDDVKPVSDFSRSWSCCVYVHHVFNGITDGHKLLTNVKNSQWRFAVNHYQFKRKQMLNINITRVC